MNRLSLVPELPPERRESAYERAGERSLVAIDAYFRRELGRSAVALSAGTLYAFDVDGSAEAKQMHLEGAVAGVYDGIDEVTVRRQPRTQATHYRQLEVVEPESLLVVRFSTSHGPADISNRLRKRMEKSDDASLNLASLYAVIGFALDEPVVFGPLLDGAKQEKPLPPANLHMIQ